MKSFFKNILIIYWILFVALTPVVISISPVIISLILDDEIVAPFFIIVSVPVGSALGLRMWTIEYFSKFE